MTHFFRTVLTPLSLLAGSIIGAGLFALPFAFHAAGLLSTILYIIFFGALISLAHVLYADIILRTQETRHQFPGYVRIYLGKRIGAIANIAVSLTTLLTLTAYLILSISFLSLVFPGLPTPIALLLFWLLGSVIIFTDIKKTATFDTITGSATILMIIALFAYWIAVHPEAGINAPIFVRSAWFLPFGPILFALTGFSAIPALIEYSRKERIPLATLRRTIIAGTFITAFLYFLFTLAIWGLSGVVSSDSVSGMLQALPPFALLLWGLFGFISLWDSYASVGQDLLKTMRYDWKLPPVFAAAGVLLLPPILYLLGIQSFIATVGIIGSVMMGTWGILLVLTWRAASHAGIPSVKFSKLPVANRTHSLIGSIPFFVIVIMVLIFAQGIIHAAFRFFSLL